MPSKKSNDTSRRRKKEIAAEVSVAEPFSANVDEDPEAAIAEAIADIEQEHGGVFGLWRFPEYRKHERGKWWYITMVVLSILLVVFAVLANNILFAIIIIVADIIIFLQGKNQPMDMIFVITEDGILVHHKFYPYRDLQNFWIAFHPPAVKTLYFKPKAGWRPEISISLEEQDPIEIREILLQFLDEDLEEEDEKTADALSRLLKL